MLLDNIWVINLDKSKDRLQHIKNEFNKYNMSFKRFSAIYGKDLDKDTLINETTLTCRTFLCSYGMIGCALSHKTLWKQLLSDETTNYYLICEDDVVLTDKFLKFIIDFDKLKDDIDFDMINFSCRNIGCGIIKDEIPINDIKIGKCLTPLTTTSYLISKKGANKLLKILSKVNYHIDIEIAYTNYFNDFNYYATSEPLVNFLDDDSTLTVKNNCLTNKLLKHLNINYYCWLINEPVLVVNLEYSISWLVIFLLLLLLLNIFLIK